MKYHLARILGVVFLFSGIAYGAHAAAAPVSYTGVVTKISGGVLYIGGISHRVATVNTAQGTKLVACSNNGRNAANPSR